MEPTKYQLELEDMKRMAELAGMEVVVNPLEELARIDAPESPAFEDAADDGEFAELFYSMAQAAFTTTSENNRFFYFFSDNRDEIREAVFQSEEAEELLLLCFKAAISNGSALCMNCLGALYYLGDIVEQDYARAAELYEMAMAAGCYQSIINLGYIYEYGRTGAPDHQKAFQFYALAAALAPSREAAYKLGGMFSRGRAVPRNMSTAHALYARSYKLAESDEEIAQPAIRIAKMLIDPEGPSYGVETDPLRALALYQRAEIGLRKDIANGQVYYRKRLQEAIDGQKRARALIDESEGASEHDWLG